MQPHHILFTSHKLQQSHRLGSSLVFVRVYLDLLHKQFILNSSIQKFNFDSTTTTTTIPIVVSVSFSVLTW